MEISQFAFDTLHLHFVHLDAQFTEESLVLLVILIRQVGGDSLRKFMDGFADDFFFRHANDLPGKCIVAAQVSTLSIFEEDRARDGLDQCFQEFQVVLELFLLKFALSYIAN